MQTAGMVPMKSLTRAGQSDNQDADQDDSTEDDTEEFYHMDMEDYVQPMEDFWCDWSQLL